LWLEQSGGDGKGGIEAFDCAERHHVEGGWGQSFRAGVLYIDVRQSNGASDLAQESGFLVVRFDEGKRDRWNPELDGDTGEAGTGAKIGKRDFA
jgi:hypothetical protein